MFWFLCCPLKVVDGFKIKQRGFIEPVKFFVNIEVRFVEEVFKRCRIRERDSQNLERVVDRHLKLQFVVNNGYQTV